METRGTAAVLDLMLGEVKIDRDDWIILLQAFLEDRSKDGPDEECRLLAYKLWHQTTQMGDAVLSRDQWMRLLRSFLERSVITAPDETCSTLAYKMLQEGVDEQSDQWQIISTSI
jgi:hypothetical protein